LLADKLHTERREPAHLRSNRVGRAAGQIEPARRDDSRSLDDAFVDVIPQREVTLGRTAAGENRRVAGVEQRLHLLLLVRAGVDVPMRVDEAGTRGQTTAVDRLAAAAARRARSGARDAASAHEDETLVDDRAVADDDANVGDGEVLGADRSRHD